MQRGSDAWRRHFWGPPCAQSALRTIELVPGVRITVQALAVEWFRALGEVFRAHGYTVRRTDTGAYNCRTIKGTSTMSAHSWGLAVDVNWQTNPFTSKLVTDMSPEMIQDVYGIRTGGGVRVFRWGGDWDARPDTPHSKYDAMHFEIHATPNELAGSSPELAVPVVGMAGLRVTAHEEDDMIRREDKGDAVTWWQHQLEAWKADSLPSSGADGVFGEETETAVKKFQGEVGLPETGIIDLTTGAALIQAVRVTPA